MPPYALIGILFRTVKSMALSAAQRRTLAAVCSTLMPDADPSLAEQVEAVLAQKDSAQLAQLGQALSLLESGLAGFLLTGQFGRFGSLPGSLREERLRRWANHPLPPLRQAFQGLKRLAAFLYWAAPDQKARAPWGYGRPDHPAADSTLRVTPATDASEGPYDAIIVGSGAGGSVIAAHLAAAGMQVLILEKGEWLSERELGGEELDGMARLYLDGGMTATTDLSLPILAGGTVGGGTTVNWTAAIAPPDWLRAEWERKHGLTGLTGAEFQRCVDEVQARLGVNRNWSTCVPTQTAGRLLQGAAALGYEAGELARNVQGCEGDCAFCTFGCRAGAKQSTRRTYLMDALAHGATLVAGADVRRVLVEAGAVTGVEVHSNGDVRRFRAPRVVVAAGAIASPALLLRSGLGNEHVGRHLHLHPVVAVAGLYPQPVNPWSGRLLSAYSNQFQRVDGDWGFLLEHAPAHPGLGALAFPWHSGEQFTRDMTNFHRAAAFIALVRDRGEGQVRIDRAGHHQVTYRVAEVDRRLLLQGQAALVKLHEAAGAEQILTCHSQYSTWRRGEPLDGFLHRVAALPSGPNQLLVFSAHQMGSCRMGGSPRTSVANPEGAVWGIRGLWIGDSSAFPTALGVNPMITIMSLASWVVKRIS
jgi:choline dehydrogenase-like flavoprotein